MTSHSVFNCLITLSFAGLLIWIGASCEKKEGITGQNSFDNLLAAIDSCQKSDHNQDCLETLLTTTPADVWKLYLLANIRIHQHEYLAGYQLINEALPLTESSEQLFERAKLLELRSSIQFHHNDLQTGANDLFEAIDIFIALNKHREAAHCLVGMANLQFNSQNYDLAKDNAELAVTHYGLDKNLTHADSGYLMNVYNTLGLTCFQLNDLQAATDHYNHALLLAHKLGEEFWTALINGNAASIDAVKGNYSEAIQKLNTDIQVSMKHKEISSAASSYLTIGDIFLKQRNHEYATIYFDSAFQLYNQMHTQKIDPKYYKQMADLDEALGNTTRAYFHLKTFLQEKDSLQAKKNSLLLQQLQTKKLFEKQLNDINLLEAKNKIKEEELRIREISIVAFILILLLLILLIFNIRRNNAVLRNVNNSLEMKVKQRMASILKLNKELDTYLYRASHDIRGPILSIQGLVHLIHYTNTREEAVELVLKIDQTARTMDAMLLKLQMAYELNFRKEYEDLNVHDLIVGIVQAVQENYPAVKIKLDCDPDLKVYTNLYNLSVALRNILENACVFQNPAQPSSSVHVGVISTGELMYIRIADNGIGIPDTYHTKIFEAFQRFSIHSTGNGMGLYISQKAINNLNGTIQVKSKENAGSTFTIIIPTTAPERLPQI